MATVDKSAGRPRQAAATKDMNVKMEDRLTAILAGIDHRAVTVRQTQLGSDFRNFRKQVPGQLDVRFVESVEGFNGLLRNQQNMYRSLRIHVVKRQTKIILVGEICFNFPVDNFGKDRHVHESFQRPVSEDRSLTV
jgi:hypothetical protein